MSLVKRKKRKSESNITMVVWGWTDEYWMSYGLRKKSKVWWKDEELSNRQGCWNERRGWVKRSHWWWFEGERTSIRWVMGCSIFSEIFEVDLDIPGAPYETPDLIYHLLHVPSIPRPDSNWFQAPWVRVSSGCKPMMVVLVWIQEGTLKRDHKDDWQYHIPQFCVKKPLANCLRRWGDICWEVLRVWVEFENGCDRRDTCTKGWWENNL